MQNQDNKDLVRIIAYVPKEVAEKYKLICIDKYEGNQRSQGRPIREFIHNFIKENSKEPKIK